MKEDCKRVRHEIPAMNFADSLGAAKMMREWQANAEDMVLAEELMDYMRARLRMCVIAVEYPGYGLYN